MADFNPYAAQPQGNAFSGLSEGLNDGAQWAQRQTALDLQKRTVDMAQETHDQQQKEFKSKLGKQYFGDLSNAALMAPGAAKKAYIKRISDDAARSGINVDPTVFASLDDPNYQPIFSTIYQNMTGVEAKDKNLFDQSMSNLIPVLGEKTFLQLLPKVAEASNNLARTAAMERAATAAAANRGANQGLRQEKMDTQRLQKGQAQYDKEKAQIQFGLEGVSRLGHIMDKLENGEIKSTKQVSHLIANEEARLATMKSNFGEGTAESLAVDSLSARIGDLKNFVSGIPGDTMTPENLSQARKIYDKMGQSYMEAHDRMANTLLATDDQVQKKAILARAKSFQSQYGKAFGGWKGPGLDGETPAASEEKKGADAAVSKEPAAPAPPTQQELQTAQKIRAAINSAPPGPARSALIQKVQLKYPDVEYRKRLGLP